MPSLRSGWLKAVLLLLLLVLLLLLLLRTEQLTLARADVAGRQVEPQVLFDAQCPSSRTPSGWVLRGCC